MQDLINLGKKVAIAGGKEAMKYFRKPNLDFDNKSQTHFDPVSKADKNTENIMRQVSLGQSEYYSLGGVYFEGSCPPNKASSKKVQDELSFQKILEYPF